MRVLIARLSSLGDCVHTLPVAAALKRSIPECKIEWLVDSRFAAIPSLCTAVDIVHSDLASPWQARILGEFDLALDMQGLMKSALPVAFARAKKKLGYHWRREGAWMFTSAVQPDSSSLHVVDQYVDVARAAGAEMHSAEFALLPDPSDVESVASMLKECGRDNSRPLVLCNAGAGWASKRWPPESFGALTDLLSARGCDVAFLGAPSDRPIFEEVRSNCSAKPIDMVGKTNIAQLVALVSLSDVHVGGDTGSTHIAVALGKPVIGLYSITNPSRSGPYGQLDRCFYEPDGLRRIMPEDVSERVASAVAQ